MSPDQILGYILEGFITLAILAGLYILQNLKNSIDQLNLKVATIIEKTMWHEDAINDNKERIRSLEEKFLN